MANLKAPPPPEPTIHEYVAHAAAAAELKAAQAEHATAHATRNAAYKERLAAEATHAATLAAYRMAWARMHVAQARHTAAARTAGDAKRKAAAAK
jgi:hypothetical protein